jgi:hypothetical protein
MVDSVALVPEGCFQVLDFDGFEDHFVIYHNHVIA